MTSQTQAINTALIGDWNKAITINKSLLKENPKNIEALNRLAFAYGVIGNSKEAKTFYLKVLKIDPLNSIALRNIKRIPVSSLNENGYKVSNIFLEEPGKTKIVELLNVAPSEIINNLQTGQLLILSIKRLKIFVHSGKQFIGMLPDDIGKRLIKFIEGGNNYEAYVKSVNGKLIVIFIKETKKATKFKDQPSFVFGGESSLVLEKVKKTKSKTKSDDEDEDGDENYSEDEA